MYTQANTDVWNLIASKFPQDVIEFVRQGAEQIQDNKCAKDQATDKTCTRCHKSNQEYYGKQSACKSCFKAQITSKQHEKACPMVYAITIDDVIVYCGSTQLSLSARLIAHCSAARQGRGALLGKYLRVALGAGKVPHIVGLVSLPGADKAQLLRRERQWIRKLAKTNNLYQTVGMPKYKVAKDKQ